MPCDNGRLPACCAYLSADPDNCAFSFLAVPSVGMGVPADVVDLIEKMTYHKNQGWIDEYSCNLMAQGVPAEEATYEAREKDFVRFVETLKSDPLAAKAKSAILNVLLEDKYIKRQERRELKTKFRLKKYKAAIQALGV